MKWFYNLKISTKLLTGFIFVSLIAAVIGLNAISNLSSLKDGYVAVHDKVTIPI